MLRLFLPLAVSVLPATAFAQDGGDGVTFRFGLGPESAPGYFGDADSEVGVASEFTLERFQFRGIVLRDETLEGFDVKGSFRLIAGRSAEDYPELAGLEDIDPSVELGGGISYRRGAFSAFTDLRYGLTGHEAFVADAGVDLTAALTRQVSVAVGPRVLWGDDSYTQTYFGVSPAEAEASAFDSYAPKGGLISAGAEATATYTISDDWQLIGTIRYERLQGDAAESPLVQSDDQTTASLVVTRRFNFSF